MRLSRIECPPDLGLHVGIWWHDAQRLFAFLQSIAQIKEPGNLIDSELSHDSCWDIVRKDFSCRNETEYYEIPRGRIVWDTIHRSRIVYHGNSTSEDHLEELARIFRLPRWVPRLDDHYLTGESLEAYYCLD